MYREDVLAGVCVVLLVIIGVLGWCWPKEQQIIIIEKQTDFISQI